jgi:hypothetical protein
VFLGLLAAGVVVLAAAAFLGVIVASLTFIYLFVPAALVLGFLGLLITELVKRDLTERKGRATL